MIFFVIGFVVAAALVLVTNKIITVIQRRRKIPQWARQMLQEIDEYMP